MDAGWGPPASDGVSEETAGTVRVVDPACIGQRVDTSRALRVDRPVSANCLPEPKCS